MVEHIPTHAQLEEEQMVERMNTPVVSASHPTCKDHCNDIGNNELCISIISMHLYLDITVLVFADDAPLQRPPRATN